MEKIDVLIIGAGPAGIYTSLILQKASPVQSVSENFKIKVIERFKTPGGLTKYAFIQLSKTWAFSGKNMVYSLAEETMNSGVEYSFEESVIRVEQAEFGFIVTTDKKIYHASYVVIATGIMTYPDVMHGNSNMTIGLHTAKELSKEMKLDHGWKSALVVGNVKESVSQFSRELKQYVENVGYYTISNKFSDAVNYGIPIEMIKNYDGIIFDYNSYKVLNGTTEFLSNLSIERFAGYIRTNDFGETSIPGLYSVGSVTTLISGVPAALHSAQNVAFDLGRKLRKETKADPSGRYPYYPKENFWEESWPNLLKNITKSDDHNDSFE